MFQEKILSLGAQDPYIVSFYLLLGKIIGSILFFPGTPLTLLAGATLGVFWGTVVSLVGNTLGAALAFLFSRFLFQDLVKRKIVSRYKKISSYEEAFFEKGLSTVLFLRLIPLFPFNVLNYALCVTRVSFKDYFLGTFLGIIPGTFLFVYFGDSVAQFNYVHIIFSLIGILGLSYGTKKYYKNKKQST